jgi:GH15 family glucan-1,4-alpha-glucosidase
MAEAIEDYALIGDCRTAALVGKTGSIDWLYWPRFDSGACFAALLGSSDNGRWLIAPMLPVLGVRREYLPDTLILETELTTSSGTVVLTDFMPTSPKEASDLVRIVRCLSGR